MDESKTRVLILASNKRNIEEAVKYLTKHDHEVEVTSSVQDCITLGLKFKPEFVLLSYNHENKKVMMMPKLMSQTLQSTVVVYSEYADPQVEFRLQKSDPEHVIHAPASGPSIIRKLRAIKGGNTDMDSKDESVFVRSVMKEESEPKVHVTSSPEEEGEPEVAKAEPNTAESNKAESNKAEPKTLEPIEESINEPNLSVFDQLVVDTDMVVNEIVQPAGKIKDKLGVNPYVACISIVCQQFRGYVLMASPRLDDYKDVNQEIRRRLADHLSVQGVEVGSTDIGDIEINGMHFLNWAQEEAEFLKIYDHRGGEVAMAFFVEDGILANIVTSDASEMVAVPISELALTEPAKCDLYLHMPLNNRFLLYTRSGQRVLSGQIPRLQKHGVFQLHVRREDANLIRREQIRKFIGSKLAS